MLPLPAPPVAEEQSPNVSPELHEDEHDFFATGVVGADQTNMSRKSKKTVKKKKKKKKKANID